MELGNVGVYGSYFVVDCCFFCNDKIGFIFGVVLIIVCYIVGWYIIWWKLMGYGGYNNLIVEVEFVCFKWWK